MRSVLLRAVENSLSTWINQKESEGNHLNEDFELSRSNNSQLSDDSIAPKRAKQYPDRATSEYDELSKSESTEANYKTVMSFPNLERYLDSVGLRIYLEEIVSYISGYTANQIKTWTVDDVKSWILSVKFLGDKAVQYADAFATECIDGECLMELADQDWSDLNLDERSFTLLKACRDGWRGVWGSPVMSLRTSTDDPELPHQYSSSEKLAVESYNSFELEETSDTNRSSNTFYGQLVVLGYKVIHK